MDQQGLLSRLNANRPDLEALGLSGISLFGSIARGDANDGSDIDLAVTLDASKKIDLFVFAALSDRLSRLLGAQVDLVVEPARNPRMQQEIDRDRVRAF